MPKAAETKTWIIEKTAPLFNTKGVAGTTLSDMEKATGLTKGSIYNNFINKDEVALEVFDHHVQRVNTLVRNEMNKYQSAKDQLMAYVKIYGNELTPASFPVGGCPILNTSVEADDTHPQLRKKAAAAVNAWKNRITGLIERGMQEGEFKSVENTEETALAIIALIEGGIMIAKVTGKNAALKLVMKSVEKTIEALV